jgi:hypothetical protein
MRDIRTKSVREGDKHRFGANKSHPEEGPASPGALRAARAVAWNLQTHPPEPLWAAERGAHGLNHNV